MHMRKHEKGLVSAQQCLYNAIALGERQRQQKQIFGTVSVLVS